MNSSPKKTKILIVDDQPENIDVMRGVLREKYSLAAASNGKAAIKFANSQLQPDLILLDIMMPGMSGYEVCKKLKDNPNTSNIPIIFITGAHINIITKSFGYELCRVCSQTDSVAFSCG